MSAHPPSAWDPPVIEAEVGPSISRVRMLDVDDQAISLLGWQQEYRQLSPGSYDGWVSWCSLKNVDFFVEEHNQQLHESGRPPPGTVTLGLALQCRGSGRINGHEVADNTLVSVLGGRSFDFRTPPSLEVAAVVVALDEALRYADAFDCQAALKMALAHSAVTLPPLVANHLREGLRVMLRSLGEDQGAMANARAATAIRNSLLSGFLSALAGVAGPESSPARSLAQHRRVVERAVEFMRAHAGQPLSVVDVCNAAGVQNRVLQYCFKEAFGITPMAYLRCLRLHMIRRELKDRPNEPIGDIAARWSIWHLGRFASDYRTLFGELPSATARRRA